MNIPNEAVNPAELLQDIKNLAAKIVFKNEALKDKDTCLEKEIAKDDELINLIESLVKNTQNLQGISLADKERLMKLTQESDKYIERRLLNALLTGTNVFLQLGEVIKEPVLRLLVGIIGAPLYIGAKLTDKIYLYHYLSHCCKMMLHPEFTKEKLSEKIENAVISSTEVPQELLDVKIEKYKIEENKLLVEYLNQLEESCLNTVDGFPVFLRDTYLDKDKYLRNTLPKKLLNILKDITQKISLSEENNNQLNNDFSYNKLKAKSSTPSIHFCADSSNVSGNSNSSLPPSQLTAIVPEVLNNINQYNFREKSCVIWSTPIEDSQITHYIVR